MNHWAVYRLDYNANEFLVAKGLSKEKADRLAEDYINKGHHQHYWVDKEPSERPDFNRMLSEMLQSGSATAISIKVLLGQGATRNDCVVALTQCVDMSIEDAEKLVSEVSN